ncbi:MAG: TonB-dependent receptor [Bacteroidaceae bacterium]|nr:TonB-dependent receptor [Bacteroidaceae bacterium]
MYKRHQTRPAVITWKQFANKGYCAFASLHRQVRIGVLSVATLGVAAAAQAQRQSSPVIPVEEETLIDEEELPEVTVSGTMAPLTELQSARIVSVLSRQDIEQAAVQSINDLFKLVTGVDVRQRGGFGIQTDISIDGGTFDQVTLLLNGIDIGNPQTGHLSADFPVSICDIERIEVLEGAASRVYGGQSFGGAINIVTKHDAGQNVELSAQGGSHGTAEGEARLSLTLGKVSNRISGGGGRSDGGTLNSSWQKGQLFYQGDFDNNALKLDWQLGFSKKSYGANTFYSASYPDQYERNQRLMTSISAETKGRFHFTPHVFWNRSWDNFELVRGTTFGENFHRSDVYGIKAGGYFDWRLGKTAASATVRHESILSTNLGCNPRPEGSFYIWSDNRTTVSFSLEHNILLKHWTISAGLMASMTSAIDHRFRFYPGVDIAYRPSSRWKFLFSYNKGFRLPTFTELYYKSPTHEGNRGLKAEHNHSFSLGGECRWSGAAASVRGFYHRGTRMIDWVMYAPDDIFHTASFDLDNLGMQVQGKMSFPELFGRNTWVRSFSVGYTYIHQTKHDAEGVVKSNMAMEYLRHKAVASLTHRIVEVKSSNCKWLNGICELSWDFRWQERVGSYVSGSNLVPYHPYAMLDAKLQWETPRYQLFVQATNLTNHRYYDLGSVPQPGIWVMAGARIKLIIRD